MSPLTTTEVINRGEYRRDDFNPASLTNAQLLGIFGHYNISYPSRYTKDQLVKIFEEELKPQLQKLRVRESKKEMGSTGQIETQGNTARNYLLHTEKDNGWIKLNIFQSGAIPSKQRRSSQKSKPVPPHYDKLGVDTLRIDNADFGNPFPKTSDSISKPILTLRRVILCILLGSLSIATYDHKVISASIGYCDQGQDTNRVLDDLRSQRALINECNKMNRTTLYDLSHDPESPPCPPIPLPFAPDACTQCPKYATCLGDTVTCDKTYTLQFPFLPSFLLQIDDPFQTIWIYILRLFDGLPGLGSVAFPPSCVQDPQRKGHISVLSQDIEALLGQHRGALLCGKHVVKDEDRSEASTWGMFHETLRETMRERQNDQLNFDDLFDEAVHQLVQQGNVLISQDSRFIAHRSPILSGMCTFTIKSAEAWETWGGTVISLFITVAFIYASFLHRNRKKLRNQQVHRLVRITMDALQKQQAAYNANPVSIEPFLSSTQLRDLVLQEEFSVSKRQEIWRKVENIIESNANVRVNEEEICGDEARVWRWLGSVDKINVGGRSSLQSGTVS
ncbi:hypothetical protein GYMLUDRAFT_249446 [Collybiopsis luxurians FD-317 M1]|uniref:Man1/Src1 C-terminal domain-containing protein n=1 Tax=Collybiopsis luxurians FD-317 M1 TaxID=944289 RepID=A0A0D0CHY7_9AGAR|nr:hypothetical protein GYMLUDRAFT_249446 [Collybiopsis luxurians FD-317 M1]